MTTVVILANHFFLNKHKCKRTKGQSNKRRYNRDHCDKEFKIEIELKEQKEKYHINSDYQDQMDLMEDSNISISDYNNYPEMSESELDDWIAKAAEN